MIKSPYIKTLIILFSPTGLFPHSDLNFTRRQIIELLFSVLIISILITIASPKYSDYRLKAIITHFSGEIDKKNDIFVFHAVNGRWPQGNKQLEEFQSDMGLSSNHKIKSSMRKSSFIKDVFIENGAFHILFKEELEGETLSIRPAVPEMDKTGPIILVCNKDKPGWSITGKDKTTIDDRLISRYLR